VSAAIIVIWVIAISVIVFAKNKLARVIAWSVQIFMVLGLFFVGIVRPEEARMGGEFAGLLILSWFILFPILWLIKFAYSKIRWH
jgi:hypothetical protein